MNLSETREQFKALQQGHVYLDNAATSLTPKSVLDKMYEYYTEYPGSVHRGNYEWVSKASEEYEKVRDTISNWCNASNYTVVFTPGATQSSNMIVHNTGHLGIKKFHTCLNDHHANIVPHRISKSDTVVKQFDANGIIDEETILDGVLDAHMLHLSGVFNATGQIRDVKSITAKARNKGAYVALDMSQHMSHSTLDANGIDADFYYWSAHKHYGPTGTGVLLIRNELVERMMPLIGGGMQVESVTENNIVFNSDATKFEAGTPNVAGVIGMGASIDFMNTLGMDNIHTHIETMTKVLLDGLTERKVPVICEQLPMEKRGGLVSFTIPGLHSFDVGTEMGLYGIFLRSGKLCAHPVVDALSTSGFLRVSPGVNTNEVDIARFFDVLDSVLTNG
jgi:cysteine desulfurase/selenocysteine lyase